MLHLISIRENRPLCLATLSTPNFAIGDPRIYFSFRLSIYSKTPIYRILRDREKNPIYPGNRYKRELILYSNTVQYWPTVPVRLYYMHTHSDATLKLVNYCIYGIRVHSCTVQFVLISTVLVFLCTSLKI